ncbi:MAG: PD40 domain-containing protein, partial [Bacteroidetes bacterium]|nr:PD40 domain-containing protein [Bacteroidota bacterium]
GLDRDQMEAWAIFGVYPRMSWTPDSRYLVFWAGGKIRKLDVASKSILEIPFEVDIRLTISETLRFPVEVHPERFEAKMIRDAITSPDGRTLIFHAAGYLWKKTLPDGRPERLTTDADHFEYEPSFSPDGNTIVYTTWNDEELAAVVSIPAGGGNYRVLTTRQGYYSRPRFSPDGERIVYVRGNGGGLLGNLHGLDPGIYWMPSQGGDGNLVRDGGREPRFGPDNERIYFLSGGGLSKEYKSVRLDGGDERTHLKLKYASTVEPSPDWKWVAFNELFNAYVSPFPKTGNAVDLNEDTEAIPVKKITRDVGTELHWSSDSKSLHWMIGPEYYTRNLKDIFTFVEGAPDDLPPIDSTGTRVGLILESDIPSGSVAFVGAKIVTMNGDEIIENGTVVVEGNRIMAVGPAAEVTVPAGAYRVDASGSTIIPGLVDAHAHLNHFFTGPVPQENYVYYANLAFGVTTAHDPSANTETVFTLSEMVRTGEIVGPRIFSTGTILYGADGDFKAIVEDLADARSHVRRLKAVGAISVKSYNQPRREQRQQILKAAREQEMMVVPEGGSTFFHNMTMVFDGSTGIEHNVPVAPLYQDVLSAWAETRAGYTPTLVVLYGGPSGENYWYQHTNVWENERLLKYLPRRNIDPRSRRRIKIPEEEYFHIEVAAQAKKLFDRGITVPIG